PGPRGSASLRGGTRGAAWARRRRNRGRPSHLFEVVSSGVQIKRASTERGRPQVVVGFARIQTRLNFGKFSYGFGPAPAKTAEKQRPQWSRPGAAVRRAAVHRY